MNNAEGSGVSDVRTADAVIFITASVAALVLLVPSSSQAITLWQSTSTHQDVLQIYTPGSAHSWFGGTQDVNHERVGIWSDEDFTADASTTMHLWANWNGIYNPLLDAVFDASMGGNPYSGATTTAYLISPLLSYGYATINVSASSSLQEYSLPVNRGQTIHTGDELWLLLVPSWAAYGANHSVGASGTMPFVELCEGTCDDDVSPSTVATTTSVCVSNCESNVLFIPGTESSRLYQKPAGSEQQVWEPNAFSNQPDVQQLDLNSDGTSKNSIYTKASAVIDSVGFVPQGIPLNVTNIYKTFLQQLAGLKASSTIADYLVFPYDWRFSPEDVVNKGTQYDDGTHYIDHELIALAATSQTGKVTIIAHSNGGLVTKALMIKLAQEGKAQLVDKIIFVAVPQSGTPKDIAVMLNGDLTGIPGFVVSQATARGLVENMPDAFDLLPSAAYFAKVATPVIDLSDAPILRSTDGFTGNTITNVNNFNKFLLGAGGRHKPDPSDIETPDVLSPTLLANSTALHNDLDTWLPPSGVQVIQIAGWGVDTASEIVYSEIRQPNCTLLILCTIATSTRHAVNLTEDGDGTVVTASAVTNPSWPTYYISLATYNHDKGLNIQHASVTESKPFQSLFTMLLSTSSVQALPNYVTTTQPSPTSEGNSLRLRVLSPVTLDAYDNQGNHTGMIPNPSPYSDDLYIEQQIPGSYYQQYGEGQYIGLPASDNYMIKLHGTGAGTFTFEVTPVSGGVAGTPITFAGVPVTASSSATMALSSSNPSSSTLTVDEDGDGRNDMVIASSTQTTDPLSYTKLIFTTVLNIDIGLIPKIQIEAKLFNVGYLIAKSTVWDSDDNDLKDTNTKLPLKTRVLNKLSLIETYIESEVLKPVSKRLKGEQITPAQGTQILGMIEELKLLVNSKL